MTNVCFLTNHGVAGDAMFEWLPRALSQCPDLFLYLGESVRGKYFKERGRGERPDPVLFESFLKDVGGSYVTAIEAYSYRAFRLDTVAFNDPNTQIINAVRHPLVWLHFYRAWRVTNLGQPQGVTFAIDHEWNVVDHDALQAAGFSYAKEDVSYWAFLRGIQILNSMVSDASLTCKTVCIEDIYGDFSAFASFFDDLTLGLLAIEELAYEKSKKYSFCRELKGAKIMTADFVSQSLNEKELSALERYWSSSSRRMFKSFGYDGCDL